MFNNILSSFEDREAIEIYCLEDTVVTTGVPYQMSLFLEEEKLKASVFFLEEDEAISYTFVIGK